MFTSVPIFRSLTILKCSNHTFLHTYMAAPLTTTVCSSALSINDASPSIQDHVNPTPTTISLQEWQAWGTDSPIPKQVAEIVEEMVDLEKKSNAQMKFGGLGGKLKGDFKTQEDKKHREKYKALDDSEQKLHFFSARQIACRLLGSRVLASSRRLHDFLRQNNTGKLLWQVFGINAAKLCLFGIDEHEEIMWKAFTHSGRNNVWCLYPNKNAPTKSVEDSFAGRNSNNLLSEPHQTDAGGYLNFILIDGTWSNSAAMFRRLKERADLIWGDDLPCISLSTGASAMHKLRPQPSWDRTCTAGAAIGLLDELHLVSQFNSLGLDKQAEAVENSVDVLLASLTARRVRMGRSITRRQRHHDDFC
ncbi:hypothetical protein M8C21_032983 [Ambrosia artemisiifolia]|uniref:tRNA-uridine aminocarboxypropyltransferase n=1 Tax=Ambrosia artemisiifolia TaxID=4212 RepID=A0AAD5GPF4_AMBAR|nr:hypothetical protein M8C21_032983 [Ambrosia artemisiifolia]